MCSDSIVLKRLSCPRSIQIKTNYITRLQELQSSIEVSKRIHPNTSAKGVQLDLHCKLKDGSALQQNAATQDNK